MKRYWLFLWNTANSAGGGWHDFQGAFDAMDEANAALEEIQNQHYGSQFKGHIVDAVVREVVRWI